MTRPSPPDSDWLAEILRCTELLEALVDDPARLSRLGEEERRRLLMAAGRLSRPDRGSKRKRAKAFRRQEREERRDIDTALLEKTGMRTLRRAPVYPTPPLLLSSPHSTLSADTFGPIEEKLREPRKCYVCKGEYQEVHFFYDSMCPPCAELNWQKRHQTADLSGRVALVTGGRVKIGYQASIMLLRSGARVIVSTRFPHDAVQRYAREADFEHWHDRLAIYGVDLRHTPSVEDFCRALRGRFDRLDFIVNNACQTVRRPSGFYDHLIEGERTSLAHLTPSLRRLVDGGCSIDTTPSRIDIGSPANSALLSQVALLEEDLRRGPDLFPEGRLDVDLQQVDLREQNSWRLGLADVSAVELLEVHLVNAVAPFILNARLKPLMLRDRSLDKHIVNVSAMEGQFYRDFKTDKHPHTNMAKASLNMMTRTSAADYVKDGIHMNSVDTGWITDEDPAVLAERKKQEHGFSPPLDVVDGAARILDPIYSGFLSGEHVWGQFLKDYQPTPW